MSDVSKIEWTDATWNPVTGCTKVSQGCKNCAAEREWQRLSHNPKTVYFGRKFTDVRWHAERLDAPLHWKKPRRIFVDMMGDPFHKDVPDEFIVKMFSTMQRARWHTFQVLTKRADRVLDVVTRICAPEPPLSNVWLGVSVEDQTSADERVPLLLQTPAAVRFISAEPLLAPVRLDDVTVNCGSGWEEHQNCLSLEEWSDDPDAPEVLNSVGAGALINWVIAGGESGPKARPSHPDWFRSLRDQCAVAGVPFFFKQWGEWLPRSHSDVGMMARDGPWGTICHDGRFFVSTTCWNGHDDDGSGEAIMFRVGKRAAGRLLDGREHLEYPR